MNNMALCPLDGRYNGRLGTLTQVMGEAAFATYRLQTEIRWLQILSDLKLPHFPPFTAAEKKILDALLPLDEQDLSALRAIEFEGYKQIPAIRHDVKAVEYFLRLKLQKTPLKNRLNWIHFALTSEDVNSVAYALLLGNGVKKVLLPALDNLCRTLNRLARQEAASVLLARTHGQPAVPTTFGKEICVFAQRLARQIGSLKKQPVSCKFSGAVGNFNAHTAAFPAVNWPKAADRLVSTLAKTYQVNIYRTPVSTQVDPRDSYAELFDQLRRIDVILIDFCRDMWHYVSAGLVRQRAVLGEVGSSTMPQKVNPIDFENAEGNLQLAGNLCDFFSNKLPVSRLQRDLSDSTVLRNMPMVFGYMCVALTSLQNGLNKVAFDRAAAAREVQDHPEVLAEAIQTVLRAAGAKNPYETLRDATRGRAVTLADLQHVIEATDVPEKIKQQLRALTPENYTGLAKQLTRGKHD